VGARFIPAQELGYGPNVAARNMVSGKTMLVGVLVQNNPSNPLTHPLTWGFVLGINDGLGDFGLCHHPRAFVRWPLDLEGQRRQTKILF